MGVAAYAVGIVVLLLLVGPLAVGCLRAARRLLPDWHGSQLALAAVVLVLGLLTLTGSVLGAMGVLTRWPTAVVSAAEGTLLAAWGRGAGPRLPSDPPWSRLLTLAGGLLALSVAGEWTAGVLDALRHGVIGVDSWQYHLPEATRFVQTGWTTHLHYTSLDAGVAFYPANSELLNALAILPFHRDILVPLQNAGWLAMALLAGWSIGRRYGSSPLTLATMSVVCATPIMALSAPGAATNDIAVIALIGSAVALLDGDVSSTAGAAVAGMAGGLALGTKLDSVFMIGALTVAVFVVRNRRRWARPVAWTTAVVIGGCFWYLRNLADVGSPLPNVHLPGFPSPVLPFSAYNGSALHYLVRPHFLVHDVPPAAKLSLGVLWPVLLLAASAGAILLCARRGHDSTTRTLGVAAVVGILTYPVTPDTAGGPPGHPFLFGPNLRYLLPALFVGLVGLVAGLSRRWQWGALALAAVLCLSEEASSTGLDAAWSTRYRPESVAVMAAIVVLIAWWFLARRTNRLALSRLHLAAAVAVAIAAFYPVQQSFLRHRYATSETQWPAIARWANGAHDTGIGVVGFSQQYQLTGTDLTNAVQYVGRSGPHGAFLDISTCAAFVAALDDGRYRFVVAGPFKFLLTLPHAERAWLAAQPHARLVLSERPGPVKVYRVNGRLDPASCP